jgi:TonB-dependent SusC/RagA subfamily outer membrane receptor
MKLFNLLLVLSIGLLASCASTNTNQRAQDLKDPSEISTNYNSLADYLKRVPGVQVTQRGASYDIKVRGMSSITGSNEPLFVVDRQQIGGYDDAASIVDPNDIKRVVVLKDVASTAPYGMRGANGVVVIYTNK